MEAASHEHRAQSRSEEKPSSTAGQPRGAQSRQAERETGGEAPRPDLQLPPTGSRPARGAVTWRTGGRGEAQQEVSSGSWVKALRRDPAPRVGSGRGLLEALVSLSRFQSRGGSGGRSVSGPGRVSWLPAAGLPPQPCPRPLRASAVRPWERRFLPAALRLGQKRDLAAPSGSRRPRKGPGGLTRPRRCREGRGSSGAASGGADGSVRLSRVAAEGGWGGPAHR